MSECERIGKYKVFGTGNKNVERVPSGAEKEKSGKEAIEFIAQIPYSYIRMGIVYKYQEGLTWREAAQRMGFMNEDSLRTAIRRYLKEHG